MAEVEVKPKKAGPISDQNPRTGTFPTFSISF